MNTLTKNKNLILFCLFVIVAICFFGFSKKEAHAKWQPRQNTSPFDLYNHDNHHTYFGKYNVTCDLCHKTDDSYTDRNKVEKMGCHFCHNNAKSPAPKASRFKCVTCHKDLTKVMPRDHKLSWRAKHQAQAKEDKRSCLKCHKSYFCTDCHQKRDMVDKKMHNRLFRYTHSIEARGDPKKCTACHSVNYCKECHAKP